MLFTHEGRLTRHIRAPKHQGRLETVLRNWEESDGGRRALTGPALHVVAAGGVAIVAEHAVGGVGQPADSLAAVALRTAAAAEWSPGLLHNITGTKLRTARGRGRGVVHQDCNIGTKTTAIYISRARWQCLDAVDGGGRRQTSGPGGRTTIGSLRQYKRVLEYSSRYGIR